MSPFQTKREAWSLKCFQVRIYNSSQCHTFTLVVVSLFLASVNSRQSLQVQLPVHMDLFRNSITQL